MNCQVYMCVAIVIIIYFIFTQDITEHFKCNDSIYFRIPFLFNVPTRNMPIYQDIRGSPNAAYTIDSLGTITHFGYKFGPYLYDTQGNRIKYMNNSYYVS